VTFLLSPTEFDLLPLFGDKGLRHSRPEQYGVDVLTLTPRGWVGWQRKKFPNDLLASLDDGRLARELSLMAHLDIAVLISEGEASYTTEGHIIADWSTRWTKTQLRNLFRSILFTHGVWVEHTSSLQDTRDAILEMEAWLRKGQHRSLLTRPKNTIKDTWGQADKRDWARFFLQGLPGVGSSLAEAIYDHFGRVPLHFDCTQDELRGVMGIGEKRAKTLWEVMS